MLKVTCALIISDGKLLLAQLGKNSAHPYKWEFPGGKIKEGESAEACIKREIREELDVSVKVVARMKPVVYDYGIRKIELIPFICTIESGDLMLHEHIAFRWVTFNQLNSFDLVEADKELILIKENSLILKKHLGEKVNNS